MPPAANLHGRSTSSHSYEGSPSLATTAAILQVIPHFVPAYGFGGPVTMAGRIATGLALAGYDVEVWTSDAEDISGKRLRAGLTKESGVNIHRFRYLSSALFRSTNVLFTPAMACAAAFGSHRPDLIHLHDFRSFQAACAHILSIRSSSPLVLQPHGTLEIRLGKEKAKSAYDKIIGSDLLERAARLIALTREEADLCKRLGVPSERIAVIPNGVSIPGPELLCLRGNFRRRHRIREDDFVVLFLGRIRASKGAAELLEGFEMFAGKQRNAVLVLAGPEDLNDSPLIRFARRANLRILTLGTVSGQEKSEVLLDSDVFCLPSSHEALSVSLLEAASFGLPIITSRSAAPEEFVSAGACICIRVLPESIAEGLEELASSSDTRAEIGSRALRVVREYFREDLMLARIMSLYCEVLERDAARSSLAHAWLAR